MKIQKFKLSEPISIAPPNAEITIYNSNGLLYYHPLGKNYINLPIGDWTIETKYKIIPIKFQPYCKEPLIKKVINNISFATNENKATIDLVSSKICIDNAYKECGYLPLVVFLLTHEHGHTTVDNSDPDKEYLCDIVAIKWMLSNGYNPSQINVVASVGLDNKNRVQFIHNYINQKLYK